MSLLLSVTQPMTTIEAKEVQLAEFSTALKTYLLNDRVKCSLRLAGWKLRLRLSLQWRRLLLTLQCLLLLQRLCTEGLLLLLLLLLLLWRRWRRSTSRSSRRHLRLLLLLLLLLEQPLSHAHVASPTAP